MRRAPIVGVSLLSVLCASAYSPFLRVTSELGQSTTRAYCAPSSSVADLRKEYSRQGLNELDLPADPYDVFQLWFSEACDAKVLEPNAMCLSTCKDNTPTARYVLLKAHDERGYGK